MPNYNNNRDSTLDYPEDRTLPFFAYGVFKPGQAAYSQIEEYVDRNFPSQISYRMLMRDGVPIIKPENRGNPKTDGFLIEFRKQSSSDAYKTICKTQHNKLYRWEEIYVDGLRANVLMGVNPDLGSSPNEMGSDYDGRDDPFFNEALETVENELKDETKHWSNMNDFFRLQMSYMLLWASIERYCSLKYDNTRSKINHFSRDELFRRSLREHVHSKRTVYSADDLREYTLDSEKPYDSARYYYTIRCNVVHRGKAIHGDEHMLRQSLNELLKIFMDVLRDTFDKKQQEE